METKSAFISVVGRPNVGKSSLLNKLIGQKISIVSNKPQTTRTKIIGVLNREAVQLVFVDTPGFHKPHNLLGKNMIKAIEEGMSDVDAAVLVVDAAPKFRLEVGELPAAEIDLLSDLTKRRMPIILAINKIDLLREKEALLEIIARYNRFAEFTSVVPISAKTGDGIDILEKECMHFAKPSVHYFGDEDITDQPDRVMVAELIREKLLRCLDKEIPHGIAVDLERFFERDREDGAPILQIDAVIYCEKESHKGIIIGGGGKMLKKIGMLARRDIEAFYGIPVSLKLWVKTKEDWRNRQGLIHTFGLDGE